MPKRKYGSAFTGSRTRRVRPRRTRFRRRRRYMPYRSRRNRPYRRRTARSAWYRAPHETQWPVRKSVVTQWVKDPGVEFHHYTYKWNLKSSASSIRYYHVLELTSLTPNCMHHTGQLGQLTGNTAMTVNTPDAKLSDYNSWAHDYPYGERLLFKETYTTVRITHPDLTEFPIEVQFILFRPKYKSNTVAHTDVAKEMFLTQEGFRVLNRERFEVKTVRIWRPKEKTIAASEPQFTFKLPINRVCRTVDGRPATQGLDWQYSGEQGWYLLILHNDVSDLDAENLNFTVQHRIMWLGDHGTA